MPDYTLISRQAPTLWQRICLRTLGLFGWTVVYKPVPGPRGIVVVYPHTSNWDFPIGLLAKWGLGIPFRFLGKPALFRWPLGAFMRAVGGEPIERDKSSGAIQRLAERMQAADFFWLVITPEGTRSYRPHWRSGFYHIALAAKVPLALVQFDYATKQVKFADYLDLTGDEEKDLAAIRAAFAGCVGKHPKDAAPIVFSKKEKKAAVHHSGLFLLAVPGVQGARRSSANRSAGFSRSRMQ